MQQLINYQNANRSTIGKAHISSRFGSNVKNYKSPVSSNELSPNRYKQVSIGCSNMKIPTEFSVAVPSEYTKSRHEVSTPNANEMQGRLGSSMLSEVHTMNAREMADAATITNEKQTKYNLI